MLSRRRLLYLAAGAAVALVMFLVLAVLPWESLRRADMAAPVAGHAWLVHAAAARAVVRVVTDLGSPVAVDVLAAAAVVVLLVVHRWRAAVVVAVVRLGELATESVLKAVVHRSRPGLLPQLTSASGDSFPSGHAAGSAAVYGVVAIVVGAWLSTQARRLVLAGAAAWVALIAASRVLLGVHYPTDVLGGAALGVLWLALALALVPPAHQPNHGGQVSANDAGAR